MRRLLAIAVLIPAIFALAACGGSPDQPTIAAPTEAPTQVESTPVEAVPGAADVTVGAQVWQELSCHNCHGDQAEGGSAPTLAGTQHSFEEVLGKVRQGGAIMPAFTADQVSDQQVQDIYAWLASLS